MTRRVRFTPLVAAGVFAAALGSARPAAAGDVPLVPQAINGAGGLIRLAPGDVDGDGDLDVVQIDEGVDRAGWFENVDGSGAAWTFRTISTAIDGPRGVAVADVDRDGDLDVAVASVFDSRITWFENAAGNASAWTFRTVSTAAPSARTLAAADVDGDGDTDLAYATGLAAPGIDFVTWFENPGAGPAWTAHTVATMPVVPYTVSAADVDGDGDQDLFSQRSWHENLAGDGTTWSTHALPASGFQQQPVDVDRDGDVDLLQGASALPTSIRWLENTAGNGSAWAARTLGGLLDDAINSLSAGDVDGDGDPDVVYAMGFSYAHRVRWFENTSGTGASWILRTLSTALGGPRSALPVDLDGDGDLDVTAAANNAGFTWFRNETIHGNACFVGRVISTATAGAQSIVPSDVDGDGDPDAVSTAFLGDTVAWHENVGGAAANWTARTISTAFDQAARVAAGDVDRDGDVDVAAVQGNFAGGALTWFDNTSGNGSAWTPRTVSTVFGRATHLEMIDLSGDGDLDLLGAGYYTPGLRWFENAAGNGSAWTPGTIPTIENHTGVATGDLDGDGDPDVSSVGSFFTMGLVWNENTAGNGSAWASHTIATLPGATYAMEAVDMDGDGDLDVLQPGTNSLVGNVVWYENVGGAGASWTPHFILGADGVVIATADDLDRDGDPDVIVPGGSNGVRWFENTAGNGSAWSGHTMSSVSGTPGGLSAADLDRDGDPDVLSATAITNTLAWHENQGGQAAVAVVDQAPPTANNSDVVSMLRATVSHLGRPGDGPLELASLGLRLEESPGDPLTTAEANALVESLRVYRDANGNGVFEPGSDVLVTTIGTLALAGGVQVVPFTDGDANVQVTLGTPRDYFVVVELTATASGQVPNQLMVTLLQVGPSASVMEDRTFDIRLSLACPADVSSTIKQAVPVELTGFSVE